MTLSDKIWDTGETEVKIGVPFIFVKDVKEFIKELKSCLCAEMFQRPEVKTSMLDRIPQEKIMKTIDKLAGKELV